MFIPLNIVKYLRSIFAIVRRFSCGLSAGNYGTSDFSFVTSHCKLFTKSFCFVAEHAKSNWLIAATTFILKSQFDKSVLCIIFDVFAAVEIRATAK